MSANAKSETQGGRYKVPIGGRKGLLKIMSLAGGKCRYSYRSAELEAESYRPNSYHAVSSRNRQRR